MNFFSGLLFTVRMAGFALLQPLIGLLADRFNRKYLMVITNLIQAVLALCFLLVNDSSDIVWMIGLSGVMMVLHGVYMTAERAALPNVVSEEDLATANALDAASWSTALCIGAMLGGVVVSIWGTNAAFIVDSATFLFGTVFLINLKLPQTISDEMKGPGSPPPYPTSNTVGIESVHSPRFSALYLRKRPGTLQAVDLLAFISS